MWKFLNATGFFARPGTSETIPIRWKDGPSVHPKRFIRPNPFYCHHWRGKGQYACISLCPWACQRVCKPQSFPRAAIKIPDMKEHPPIGLRASWTNTLPARKSLSGRASSSRLIGPDKEKAICHISFRHTHQVTSREKIKLKICLLPFLAFCFCFPGGVRFLYNTSRFHYPGIERP